MASEAANPFIRALCILMFLGVRNSAFMGRVQMLEVPIGSTGAQSFSVAGIGTRESQTCLDDRLANESAKNCHCYAVRQRKPVIIGGGEEPFMACTYI